MDKISLFDFIVFALGFFSFILGGMFLFAMFLKQYLEKETTSPALFVSATCFTLTILINIKLILLL